MRVTSFPATVFRFGAALVFAFAPIATPQDKPGVDEAIRLTDYGVEAARKGLWHEASIRWQQALLAVPDFPAAHNNLAVVSEHFGRYEQARIHYDAALKITNSNRYIESNVRMFTQFYAQHVQELANQKNRKRVAGERLAALTPAAEGDTAAAEPDAENEPADETVVTLSPTATMPANNGQLIEASYSRVGTSRQVFIKHPKRETPLSGKYRKVYIAGFVPLQANAENLNFETTEFLRSELRKHPTYDIVPLDELSLPKDLDEFDKLIDDSEFWQRLGTKVGSDLVVYGTVNFLSEPSDGYFPYEYQDRTTGQYRTAQMRIQRTAFTIELDLYFHESVTGELVYQDSFSQTIVYRGRLDPTLQAFYDVMNRVLPRFMDIMVPREHDAIRFLVHG